MKVDTISSQYGSSKSLATSVTLEPDSSYNESDAQWFQAALNDPSSSSQTQSSSGGSGILTSLTGAIDDNQRAQQKAMRSLDIASRSTNPQDFSKADAIVSDYYIQNLMNTKIISKGVQSLDKLTNLQ